MKKKILILSLGHNRFNILPLKKFKMMTEKENGLNQTLSLKSKIKERLLIMIKTINFNCSKEKANHPMVKYQAIRNHLRVINTLHRLSSTIYWVKQVTSLINSLMNHFELINFFH